MTNVPEQSAPPEPPRQTPVINLLPPRRREARHQRVRARVWFGISVSCGLILGGVYGTWSAAWADDSRDFSSEIARVAVDIDEINRAAVIASRSTQDEKVTLAVDRAIWAQADWSLLLGLLSRSRGDQIVLNRVMLDSIAEVYTSVAKPTNTVAAAAVRPATPGEEAKEFSINIEGLGRSNSAVSEFVLRLESLGLFDSVVLQKGTRETFLSGEAVAFRIQCGIKADGGAK